jgi:hypothetical protein
MSGLDAEQLDELEQMVGELLKNPWAQGTGRPKELTLREALILTSGYMRNNIIELVWVEIFDVDQSTISRYITFLTPLIDQATTEFRALCGGGSGGHQRRDRPGGRDLVAVLVLDRRARAVGWEVQDDGSRVADHHESGWPGYFRVRTGSRQPA